MKQFLVVIVFIFFAVSIGAIQEKTDSIPTPIPTPAPTPTPTLKNVKIAVPKPDLIPADSRVISTTDYQKVVTENARLKQEAVIYQQNIDALLALVIEAESSKRLILKELLKAPNIRVVKNAIRQVLYTSLQQGAKK